MCGGKFHLASANISHDIFCMLLPILPVVGWLCDECVTVITPKRQSLQAQLDHLSSSVQKLQQNYSNLQVKDAPVVHSHVDDVLTCAGSTNMAAQQGAVADVLLNLLAIIIIIVYYAEAAKTIQYNKAQSEYTKNYRNYRKV